MVITDAQVTAAVEAYLTHEGWATDEIGKAKVAGRMRAALEAAEALTEEPEYEYRRAWQDGTHAWPFGYMDTEEGAALEAVQRVPEEDEEPEYFRGTHIERRTKAVEAGEWEKVDE